MIDSYLTLGKPISAKLTRKKSRFIALLYSVASQEAIDEILDDLRRHYHDASHCCYAYRLMGESGPIVYTHDAGEPAGSAGGPILRQVEAAELYDVLAVVVRYFGGRKLGLGGLIHAYADVTKVALSAAAVVEKHREVKITVQFPPEISSRVMGLIHRHPAKVEEVSYSHGARILIALPPSCLPRFTEELQEVTGARAQWEEKK